MENASKALAIAGGVLISLLVIGALLLMFNNLSDYQKVGEQDEREAQMIEFNNQFITYLRDKVRGNEILSLMNRVVDYNTRKVENSQEQYQKIKITISGIEVDKLKYNENDEKLIETQYTQDNMNGLLRKVKELENKYQLNKISTLSSNITKVMDSQGQAENILQKGVANYGGYDRVKKDTALYYQYSQFKRLYFNCDNNATKYDEKTGRISEMKFTCTNRLD